MITETRHHITFKLDDELFAIDVAQVREVLEDRQGAQRSQLHAGRHQRARGCDPGGGSAYDSGCPEEPPPCTPGSLSWS